VPAEKPHRRLTLTPPTAVPTPGEHHSPSPFGDEEITERDFPIELTVDQARVEAWEAQLSRLVDRVERLTATVERLASNPRMALTHTYQVETHPVGRCFPTSRVGSLHREREVIVVLPSATGGENEAHTNGSQVDEAAAPARDNHTCQPQEKVAPLALDRVFIQVRATSV
jgi:hypothetical protein